MQPDYFIYLSNLCSDLMYNDANKVYNTIDIIAFILSFYDKSLITKDQRNSLIKQIYGNDFDTKAALYTIKIAKNIVALRRDKNIYYIIRELKDRNITCLIADSNSKLPYHQVYLGNIVVDKDMQAAFDFNIAQKVLQKFRFGNFIIIPLFTRKQLKRVQTDVWSAYIL